MATNRLGVQITVVSIVFAFATAATADWDPLQSHKMHYPQMPDPMGWDVNVTADMMFDDWMCSGSGPVSDVHFWVSWRNDAPSQIIWIDLEIWSDMPVNSPNNVLGYSYPDVPLWSTRLQPGDWTARAWGSGVQGWFDPQPPENQTVIPNDHFMIDQINITDIKDPWVQTRGEIYWLGIHIGVAEVGTEIGWKTTLDHWNDDAVYWWTFINQVPPEDPDWREMVDPFTGASLDLAFVITPEPSTLALLALAGASLVLNRRR